MPTDAQQESKLDFLGLARLRFKRCVEAEKTQREAILEAKKFRAGDQWPEAIKVQRAGGQALQGVAAQPARPCLTIDRISAPVRQVSNTVRAANFAIDVHPNGFGADDETARILKGLLRQIQNDARGEDPIEWAADGAAEGGIGWFRLYADYCYQDPDAPPETLRDQDLKLGRIGNNLSIYTDPSAVKPTKGDMRFAFETEDISREEFVEEWGEAKLSALDEFRSQGDDEKWVGDDAVRICNYWTCDYIRTKVWESIDGQIVVGGPKPEDGEWSLMRTLYEPEVKCARITACHVLKKWDWPGTRIPLFPVLGEELNVDGKQVLRGVIQPAMDPQRMVNYEYSAAVEQSALFKAKIIAAAGQIENYKAMWQNANVTNYAYLPYDPVSIAGTPVPPPQMQQVEAPIQAMVELLHISEEAVKATTSIYDPSLGNTNPREKSGRAILALQQQAEHANSNYVDNVQRALVDCGTELVRLAPIFYDRPGRVLKIAGIDDQPEQYMLGNPQELPAELVTKQQGLKGFFSLSSQTNYSVTVEVGKHYATKRDENTVLMGDLLSKNPQLLQVFGDLFFRDLGQQEISDRLKKLMPPQLQNQQGQGPDPQQMQAQIAQAGQMVEMLSKELNAKNQIIQTDGVKAQYKLQETQFEQETRLKIAEIQAAAQLAAVDAKVNAEQARTFVEAMEAKIAQAFDAHMEKRQQLRDHAHEAAMQAVDHAHQASLAQQQGVLDMAGQAVDQAHEARMTASQQVHEADQAQQEREAAAQQAQQQPTPQGE